MFGSNATAEIDVDALPVAGIIRSGEASKTGGDAALDETFGFHVIESRGRSCRRAKTSCNGHASDDYDFYHYQMTSVYP